MKRVLFDHCVPKPLSRHLRGLAVSTCYQQGWDALRNGELLLAAEEAGFEVFVTADKNLRYQQALATRAIAIVELPRNRLALLLTLVVEIQHAIESITAGEYLEILLPEQG